MQLIVTDAIDRLFDAVLAAGLEADFADRLVESRLLANVAKSGWIVRSVALKSHAPIRRQTNPTGSSIPMPGETTSV
jgi:hypothetical protein